ncbi:MAG: flippase [Methanobacterium sp.]|uniref:flippase n=1 Tax=Methanobacterium sp. TaxID=2164 RepID=UPI003D660308|nr:flippase [Methanobacterium sp.]
MTKIRKIAKNTTLLLVSQIVSYALGFLYVMYSAHYLGAEGFGILSFALGFAGILGIVADFGLSQLTVREVARDKSLSNKFLGNALTIKVLLAISILLFTTMMIIFKNYSPEITYVLYFIVLYNILIAYSQIFYATFQAYEKMEYQAIGTVLMATIILIGTLIAIYSKWDVVGFASVYLIASLLTFIYTFIICIWKFFLPKIEFDIGFLKPTLKEAWPFGITGILVMLYTYIDTVMLSFMQGNEVVGWYNAAYRLIMVLLFIPVAINIAVYPVMSQFYVSSRDSLKLIYEKIFKFMLILGLPIGVGTTILAEKIILLIFGTGYTQSIIALQILIWTIVLTFASAAFLRLFESINKQLIITKISVITVLINIILNLILIPKFSYVGSSFATVITELILMTTLFAVSYKIGYGIPLKKFLKDMTKIIAASIFMGIFLWHFESFNWIIAMISAVILYFGVLYVFKILDEEDMLLIKQVIKLVKK